MQGQELPLNASSAEKFKYKFLCPPHGKVGVLLTYTIFVLSFWGSCAAMFGDIATPPNGTVFWLIILVILAMFCGWVFSLVRLPPLLGMLIIGKLFALLATRLCYFLLSNPTELLDYEHVYRYL